VQLVDMSTSKMNKMSWRFQAAADTQRFCARDIDSRLSKREAAAVQEWIQSGKKFHVMRDHPSHSKYPMSGGMWCSTTIPNIEKLLTGVENQVYLQDMDFLNTVIWPMAQKSLLQHDSFSCDKFGGKPFPTPRVGWEHVGSVYINGKMRQGDVDILKRKGVVRKCAAIVSSTDRESPVDGVVRARKIDSDYYLYVDKSNTITPSELESLWNKGNEILTRVNRYTTEHFIPPFNAITQDMLNVLMQHGVKYIHSFDVALKYRKPDAVSHPAFGPPFGGWIEHFNLSNGVTFVVSEWRKTYGRAKDVVSRVSTIKSQICLHWKFDFKYPPVEQIYRELAKKMIA
jgi:hypothetical protein